MTLSRQTQLRQMLEARRTALEEQVQLKRRGFRETSSTETTRPAVDLSDDPVQEDIDFALVEMQTQTLENIKAALARLPAGDYGICHECDEEIPEKRLRALPFATRCLSCQESAERTQLRARRLGQRHLAFPPGFAEER